MATGEPLLHITGESVDAYRSHAGKSAYLAGGAGTIADLTTINGATALDVSNGGAYGFAPYFFNGGENLPSDRAISIVYRVSFQGWSAGFVQGMFSMAGPHRQMYGQVMLHANGTPDLSIALKNHAGQTGLSTTYAWSPTLNQWYDIVLTWDGNTTTNGVKLWIDGTNVANFTSTRSMSSPVDQKLRKFFCIGFGENISNAHHRIDEVAVYDSVITPTSVTFRDSTTGSLNGSSRTKYLFSTAFDGDAAGGSGRVIKSL